jgi:hypothetical protein
MCVCVCRHIYFLHLRAAALVAIGTPSMPLKGEGGNRMPPVTHLLATGRPRLIVLVLRLLLVLRLPY